MRHKNLYFLGIAHATIGFLLFLVVPDSVASSGGRARLVRATRIVVLLRHRLIPQPDTPGIPVPTELAF